MEQKAFKWAQTQFTGSMVSPGEREGEQYGDTNLRNMKWNDAHQVQPEPNKMLLFITTSEKLIMHGYFIKPAVNDDPNLLGTFTGIDTKDVWRWGRLSTGYNLQAHSEYEVTHWVYLVDIIPHIEF